MGLRECSFKISYGPADDRLRAFYIPALSHSVCYDRSSGFFNSSALALAATGVARLIQNEGRMRLLVGAQLDDEDVAAIKAGHDLAERVGEKMLAALADPEDALQRRRLETLAWMVATGKLEIRVVLPKGADGQPIPASVSHDYYHPKEGIFTDLDGDQIAFSGSINESAVGWQHNYEQFMVYRSWDETRPYLAQVTRRFEQLWEGHEEDWIALSVPDAVRQRLLQFRPSRAPKVDALELVSEAADQEERILFQFLRDAPFLPNATRLGVETSTVKPWPHQEHVLASLVERFPERFMLCDEVGLGKTVEAGLALRQLLISGRVRRVLILVPRSLARQWQEELYEKFILEVPFYDGHTFTDVFRKRIPFESDNPWDAFPVMLASSQLAKRLDRKSLLLAAQPWDLVVVDEAHHARRRDFLDLQRYRPNRLLQLLNDLSGRTRGVLLMTATPMQVHPIEVWDLLRLIGLGGRWGATHEHFLRYYDELAKPFDDRDWDFILEMISDEGQMDVDPALRDSLASRTGPVEWQMIESLSESPKRSSVVKQLSTAGKAVLDEMVRQRTPVRQSIFRNTRSLLRRYKERGLLDERIPRREPENEWIVMEPEERALYDRIEEYISDFYGRYERQRRGLGFVMTVYRRRLTSSFRAVELSLERRLGFLNGKPVLGTVAGLDEDDLELEDLERDVTEELAEEERDLFRAEIDYLEDFLADLRQLTADSKVEHLLRELDAIFRERDTVIIFTQYADTMDHLRDRLREVYGSRVGCYSGRGGEYWDGARWVSTSKERIKADFRKGQEIKILIGTEALSEGLNLETCGVVINYDMPWNPMRAEQRIGRIDRIGQRHDIVWVRNYFYEETVEAIVYQRLSDRIHWFEEVVGRLQPILSRVAQSIETLAMTPAAERERKLEEEIEDLRRHLEAAEAETLDLDEYADAGATADRGAPSSVTQRDIESLLARSAKLTGIFRPHPQIDRAYSLAWQGEDLAVTFDPDVFDRHPTTLRMLSYGSPLFEEIVANVESPRVSDTIHQIQRCAVEAPIRTAGYFSLGQEEVTAIDGIGALRAVLTGAEGAPPPEAAQAETARERFSQIIADSARKLDSILARERELRASADREEGRLLLLQATMVELALAQQSGLFEEEAPPFEFDEEAVSRLRKHGYPWAGLIRLVGVRGLRPSPADPFFARIQPEPQISLRGRFSRLEEAAERLLSALAQEPPSGPRALPELMTRDISTTFFAPWSAESTL